MSLKRSYPAAGGLAYGDGLLPPKVAAVPQSWPDYSQDDYNMNCSQFSMYGQSDGSTSFENRSFQTGAGAPQTGRGGGGGAKPRTMDKLQGLSGGASVSSSFLSQPVKVENLDYQQGYDGGAGYGGYGYDQSASDQLGGGYSDGYGYEDQSAYGNQSGWGYDESGEFGGTQQSHFSRGGQGYDGGAGQRGRGRGQGQQRGRGRGQSYGGFQSQAEGQSFSRGSSYQNTRGRGRGQGAGRGQVVAFSQGDQGFRGRGRGQGGQPWSGNQGSGAAAFKKPRGRGGGDFGGYDSYGGQDYNYSYNQSGQSAGRGGWGGMRGRGRGRGEQRGGGRGVGRGSTAGQVKAVSDNIMSMVTGGQGKGRGASKGQGAVGKPSSLMDIVDTAWQRKFGNTSNPSLSEEANRLDQFLKFFRTCPDRVNGIQTIGNALTASRLNLQIAFEAEELVFILKPLFTGVLRIGGIFLTRGLGLSKKAVKHDCFERAVGILRTKSVEDILAIEDCGKETLKAEVQRQSEEDFEAFKTFLCQKQAAEAETSDKIRTAAVTASQVTERNFPLADKMMMLLKEMEKSGSDEQDVAMASRFDVLCFKVGISVTALFRAVVLTDARQFHSQPFRGDPDVELICEIYYDGILVGKGRGRPRKEAQVAAYADIQHRLQKEPVSKIAQGTPLPSHPESLPDYFEIIYKGAKPQEGNNHQRLYSLKAYPPDLSLHADDMVIIEMEGDSIEDNAYKILEFSASKNSMLLEWKQLDKTNNVNGFRCEIVLNRDKTVTGMGPSKPKARNAAAAMILMDMYLSQDIVSFHNTDDLSKAVPVSAIVARAKELKEEGPPRVQRLDCVWPEDQTSTKSEKEKEKGAGEEDLVSAGKTWRSNPLHMWMEDAIVELIENHCKTITLEELIIGSGITPAIRKVCFAAARDLYLLGATLRTDPKHGQYIAFHHRGITPQEMVKILHIKNNASGRYKLVRANKPFSVVQQAQFVRTFPDVWRERVRTIQEAERQRREEAAAAATAAAAAAAGDAAGSDGCGGGTDSTAEQK